MIWLDFLLNIEQSLSNTLHLTSVMTPENNINFLTTNIIIFCYPPNAGGKFLINALGLSDNFVFQDKTLAANQILKTFSKQQKIDLLLTRLEQTDTKWNDLNLGCLQYFGTLNTIYDSKIPPANWIFNNVVADTISNNLQFPIVAHVPNDITKYLKVWPNAKIVCLTNYKDFINYYRPHAKNPMPDYTYDTSQLDIQFWNTGWYFSEKDTLENIQKLATNLGITGIDINFISLYYKKYIITLDRIKKINEQASI